MKRIIITLVAVCFLSVAAIAVANNGPEGITFEAKNGKVTFDHKAHQGKVADCTECHHKGVDAGKCSSCHDGAKAPKAKDAFHNQCKGCHKASAPEQTKKRCKGCHVK